MVKCANEEVVDRVLNYDQGYYNEITPISIVKIQYQMTGDDIMSFIWRKLERDDEMRRLRELQGSETHSRHEDQPAPRRNSQENRPRHFEPRNSQPNNQRTQFNAEQNWPTPPPQNTWARTNQIAPENGKGKSQGKSGDWQTVPFKGKAQGKGGPPNNHYGRGPPPPPAAPAQNPTAHRPPPTPFSNPPLELRYYCGYCRDFGKRSDHHFAYCQDRISEKFGPDHTKPKKTQQASPAPQPVNTPLPPSGDPTGG